MAKLPPRLLCITAAVLIVAGVSAIASMAVGLFCGGLSLELTFIGLPIGYGILIGKPSSRTWALVATVGGGLLFLGFGSVVIYQHLSGEKPIPYPDSIVGFTDLGLILLLCTFMAVTLLLKPNKEWFSRVQEDRIPAKSFTWAVIVISVLSAETELKYKWWIDEVHARIFTFDITVQPFNEDTGDANISVGYGTESTRNADDLIKGFPKVRNDVMFKDTGTELRLTGVATRPFDYFIQSEGLQEASVRIDKNSPSSEMVRLPMQPIARKPSMKETLDKERSEDQ